MRLELSKNQREVLEFVLAIAAAWLFYQGLGFVLGTSMPMVAVVSDSMVPTLHIGDLAIVQRPDVYTVGDIAIYAQGSKTIIHRIVEVLPEGYRFKGDNNPGPDPEIVAPSRVLGKVRFAIPLLGYPRLALFALGI